MKINSTVRDFSGAIRVRGKRKKKFLYASEEPVKVDEIKLVANKLHPGIISLKVTNIKLSSLYSKIIRLEGENIPYFKAGQYLTLSYKINNLNVTRPYSIISSPNDAISDKPFVEICIGYRENSISGKYLFENVKINDEFKVEMGLGDFTYNSIRDSKNIVCIAGGTGITPFLSMARSLKDGILDANITIIHGVSNSKDLVLNDEFKELLSDKIKLVHVLSSNEDNWDGLKGFIDKDIISKYSSNDSTYFICGPKAMYDFVLKELNELKVNKRRIRKEVYQDNYSDVKREKYTLEVVRGIDSTFIDCYSNESLALALEKARIKIHTRCRSGVCGICRVRVLDGEYYIPKDNDLRRQTDKEFGYVHSCSTYPRSNIKIKINI